jgi:uncharacterized protein (TIGR02996 family)
MSATPRLAFLNSVRQHPLDSQIRLEFAAWLDERCDPLGEFIRVQCRLAKSASSGDCLVELERREQELRAEFEREWLGALGGMVDWADFRGGFVEEVALSASAFLEYGDELFQKAPIQEVHLHHVRDRLEGLAASPNLARVRFLDLSSNPLRDTGVAFLARCPNLSGLSGLNLGSVSMGDAGAKALATSPHLGRLSELYLTNNRISNAGGRALAASPGLKGLTTLHLAFNAIGHDGEELLYRRFGHRVQW